MINFLRTYGLLKDRSYCHSCNMIMEEAKYARSIDEKCFRCHGCRKVENIRKSSFFEESKLELWQIFGLTYLWAEGSGKARSASYETIMKELQIKSHHTVADWLQFCRDVAVEQVINNPRKIGGRNLIVEIDESLFAKRKYNVGSLVKEQWIFGGYCKAQQKGFLIPIPDRKEETLLPLIEEWIEPGSIIYSDKWSSYQNIREKLCFKHYSVNHSQHFVDPVTGCHTNSVEGMWANAKSKFKAMNGPTNRELIDQHLPEFMWAQRYGNNAFYNFWNYIATHLYKL